MRCLVTGAAGFIGSHLCDRLLADGHEVRGIDVRSWHTPNLTKETMDHHRFSFIQEDVHGLRAGDLTGVDVVYHLAALTGLRRNWDNFQLALQHTVGSTHHLLELCRKSSVRRLVYSSTSSVYGEVATGDENSPLRPTSPYGVTKMAAEQLCAAYHRTYRVPAVVLRYFSVYGPRQRPDMMVGKFIRSALAGTPFEVHGDGRQSRAMTYVADVVDATVDNFLIPGETYNVGGLVSETVSNVAQMVMAAVHDTKEFPRDPAAVADRPLGDQYFTKADCSKLRALTGWSPTTGLWQGIRNQVEWERSQPK